MTDSTIVDFENKENKPSEFLKVWTVLTYVIDGIGVLFYLILLLSVGAISSLDIQEFKIELYNALQDGENYSEEVFNQMIFFMEFLKENVLSVALLFLFANIMCIVGAALMRKLKKIGFHIFVVAQILVLAAPSLLGYTNIAYNGISSIIFAFMFPVIAIIGYASQLKYMK